MRSFTHPVAAAALGRAGLVALQGHAPFAVQQQAAVQLRAVLLGAGGPRQQGGQRVVGDHDGVSAAEHSDWTEAEVCLSGGGAGGGGRLVSRLVALEARPDVSTQLSTGRRLKGF